MKMTTHLHLVATLGMGGAIPPLPHMPSLHAQGKTFLMKMPEWCREAVKMHTLNGSMTSA